VREAHLHRDLAVLPVDQVRMEVICRHAAVLRVDVHRLRGLHGLFSAVASIRTTVALDRLQRISLG
jgi:hypothetical protein